mmetsp:Transcript_6238/g.22517  ORF Transcript_6238/g.22517 Transcript_6238/m.22517 type:complete len:223 (-) Transcript_6238:721-1389(-)
MHHRIRVLARGVDEFVKAFSRPVIRAIRPNDVQFLQSQVRLHRAQRAHRAPDADKQQLSNASRFDFGEHLQVWTQRRLDASRGEDFFIRRRQHGLGRAAIIRSASNTNHAIDFTASQHLAGDAGDDTGPLRARDGRIHRRVKHVVDDTQPRFITIKRSRAPVRRDLARRKPRSAFTEERTRIFHVRDVFRVAQPAPRAVLLGGVRRARGDGFRIHRRARDRR